MFKRKFPWFPCAFGDDPTSYYAAIGILFFAYFLSVSAFVAGAFSFPLWGRHLGFGALALYFAVIWHGVWFCYWGDSDYTRLEKMQILALQTISALILTSPLIYFFSSKWPL